MKSVIHLTSARLALVIKPAVVNMEGAYRSTLVPVSLNHRGIFADFRLSGGKMIEGQFIEFLAIATMFYLLVLVIR